MLDIEVRYKKACAAVWTELALSPSDYFWNDPDEPDGPWRYDDVTNHVHIAERIKDLPIEFAVTRVTDRTSGSYIECAYHYWGGPNDFTNVVTHNDSEFGITRELIFSGRMPYKESGSHLVRVSLEGDLPKTTMSLYMWGKEGDEFEDNAFGPVAT